MKHLSEHYVNALKKSQTINESLIAGTILASSFIVWNYWDSISGWFSNKDKKNDGDKKPGFFSKVGSFVAGLFGGAFMAAKPKTAAEKQKAEEEAMDHKVKMSKSELEYEKNQKELRKMRGEDSDDKDTKSKKDSKQDPGKTDKKTGKDKSQANPSTGMVAAQKNVDNIKDPVQKAQLQKQLDVLRCSQYDADGNPRTPKDVSKWMQDNVDPSDLKDIQEYNEKLLGNVELDDKLAKQLKDEAGKVSDQDMADEAERSKKVSADLGIQMEADAKKRKELTEKRNKLQRSYADPNIRKQFAQQMADAGNDEEKKKQIQIEKTKYFHDLQQQIYAADKELAQFNATCESGKQLNLAIPTREARCQNAIKDIEDDIEQERKAYNEHMQELGADPKDLDNGEPKEPKEGESKEGEPKESKEGESKEGEPKEPKEGESKEDEPKEPKEETDKTPKNPASIWHKKKNKNGGSTKSYYNKKGDSISQKEFQNLMKNYKKKLANGHKNESSISMSFKDFLLESLT